MTGGFRKAAYAVVDEAKATGAPNSAIVHVVSPPGVWKTTVGELKQMLWQDRQRRRRERKVAHAK